MNIDLFPQEQLEMFLNKLAELKDYKSSIRGLFARYNHLEKEVLELNDKLSKLMEKENVLN